jgi:hypothetical protein
MWDEEQKDLSEFVKMNIPIQGLDLINRTKVLLSRCGRANFTCFMQMRVRVREYFDTYFMGYAITPTGTPEGSFRGLR